MTVSYKDVMEIYGDLQTHYGGAHAKMEQQDRIFDQRFDGLLDVPYEVRIFKSSTAANIIEGFRNQIRTNEPTVDFKPSGPSVAAGKHAVLMQKWGYAMLAKERLMAVLDPNLQCGSDLLLRGATCKKIIVDSNFLMEEPPKRGGVKYQEWEARALLTWPFISRTIDPLSIFPAPGQRKPLPFVIERQYRYASEIMSLYPEWKNPDKDKRPARKIEWIEYWSPEEYVCVADGEEVFSRENPYGLVPYIFEWSGMGRVHADGDPAHLAVGILTTIMGELEEEVRLKTAISVQTQMHVFPPILTVEDPRKVAAEFGVGPGKVIRHPPGHPPEYMKYPPPNENMYRFLDTIHQNIARVFSSALSGNRDSGVRFGVLQAQMIGQALTTIAPVRNTLDIIGARTLNMMVAMAEKLDLHMAISGGQEPVEAPLRLDGSDFTHQNFSVTFEAVNAAENDRAIMVGQTMRRAGDITRRTFWKKYAKHVVEDPDDEETGLLEEKLLEMLVMSGQLGQLVFNEGVQEQLQEAMAGAIEGAKGATVQRREADTTPQSAQAEALELEAISGTPGSQTMPRDIMERGMAPAAPSRSGLPSR